MEKINILGINISNLNKKEVIGEIQKFLIDGRQHFIVTPNPEIILLATKYDDEELFYILNRADLALADGVALKFAAWLMGKNLYRISGSDLLVNLLKMAEDDKKRVAIINWRSGLSNASAITKTLGKMFPYLKFYVYETARQIEFNFTEINEFRPDIIFCALGAPWQEKFIFHNLKKISSAKLAMAVGGSFDFLTGKIKRAPPWLRKIGLEWLWRLGKQPWRYRRIYNAVIVFPLRFISWYFVRPWFYRPNVVCLLYKRINDKYFIFIVERRDWPGHWQLPQGGRDGDDLKKAGSRELKEETGTDKFKPIVTFKNLWKYKYDKNIMVHQLAKKELNYIGQKQGLFIAEFFGQDRDIKISYWDHRDWKWIEAERLIDTVHPIRKEATRIFLEKFKEVLSHNDNL